MAHEPQGSGFCIMLIEIIRSASPWIDMLIGLATAVVSDDTVQLSGNSDLLRIRDHADIQLDHL